MSTDWSSGIRLSSVEFLACWHAMDLGELPVVLELRPLGVDPRDRDRIYRQALLGSRVGDQRGGPEPRLAGLLRLIAAPNWECDVRRVGGPRGELVALGSVAGEHGVVTARRGEQLVVLPMSGPRVAGVLVELVGPLNPGRARSVNIAAEDFDRACQGAADLWTVADRLARFGVDRGEANSTARMLTGITGGGQLGATAVVGGTRSRGRWVIGYQHTPDGDFVQFRRPTTSYGDTVTIAPVSTDRLFVHLRDLIEDLRALTGQIA
jgi:hypothetical protein